MLIIALISIVLIFSYVFGVPYMFLFSGLCKNTIDLNVRIVHYYN